MSRILDSLPPRPPTPPRETHNETVAAQPNNVLTVASIDTRPSIHTPPGISSPSSGATKSTSRRRKKVGFSARAEYKEAPVYPDGLTPRQNPTPVSLPRSASKPVKSILKVTAYDLNPLESANGDSCDAAKPVPNLATMLESSVQMLAGGDRHAKIDAYTMLPRALRASNNLPDRVALQDKMGLLMQFMQRDITSRTPDGNLDSSLVNHALNLLKTLLGFPAIASSITNDFGIFIIDHCIRSFEDPSVPKDVVRHLMQVITIQNFSNKVMTSDRVGRLVTSLRNIEEHLQGKSIVMSRVLIYRKLVKQVRPLMVMHSDWLFDLFTDMLSTLREIRSSAIALGFEAAFCVGQEKLLSRKAMEIFRATLDDKQYVAYYKEKLMEMAKEKHESSAVPQIWSVVTLILRVRLSDWDYREPWLGIIQASFNSAQPSTRLEANFAWNRLVYLMQTADDGLYIKNLSTLTSPLIMQLKRKGPPAEIRKAIFSSICNLLYYTFKPNTSGTQLSDCWDISVRPLITKLLDPMLEPSQEYLHHATATLTGLFDCSVSKLWKLDRVVSNTPVKPDELPAIDSKWIRENSTRVFATVQPVLERDFLSLADNSSPAFKLWQSLVGTVASAASREVRVAKDTATFVTEAFNMLQSVWERGVPVDENAQPKGIQFLQAVTSLLEVLIDSLGHLPFTQKSGRRDSLKAPLNHLFSILSDLPPGVPDDQEFAHFFVSVFAPFFASSKTVKAKMDLSLDLLQAVPMETPRPYGPWVLVAGNILAWLENSASSHHSSGSVNENPVGHDYRTVVKVLERGIRSTPNLPWIHWESLFYALHEEAHRETGDAGVAIIAIEPLAKVALEQLTQRGQAAPSENTIQCIITLLSVANHPRDKQAIDAAKRRLWGTALAGRSTAQDPFDNLYKAVSETLGHLYQIFNPDSSAIALELLKGTAAFFSRCNRQLFFKTMIALQDGFLPWLQDSKRLLGSHAAFSEVKTIWDRIANHLPDADKKDLQLTALEPLFCAALGSSHRYIVNSTVALWNQLFGNAEHVDYPEDLKKALLLVQPHADINLPGLDVSSAEYDGQQPLFVESLDEYSLPKMPYTRSSRRGTPLPTVAHSESPRSSKFSASAKRVEVTPKKSTRSNRRNTTPRLRHDDSQVQFAPIEPSPLSEKQLESQVLTERQKEVRERQKETIALFPEIRSSPGPKSKETACVVPGRQSSSGQGHNPQVRVVVTPEPDGGYDDYVSSTPTPRRGQPIHIPDHDMMDPPSSPPEPRGNPLAAEIRSRSASNSLLDDWQFSSSPISGSPNPNRQAVVPEPAGDAEDMIMSDADEELPQSQYRADLPAQEHGPELIDENEIIEDSVVVDRQKPSSTIVTLDPIGPQTPQKGDRQAQRQETPKSDNEVFVDAPTSPLPPTPRRTERVTRSTARSPSAATNEVAPQPVNNTSFGDISDLDERSLLRLVAELDAPKIDRTEYVRRSASPEKNKDGATKEPEVSGALDCIVVGDSPKRPTSSQGFQRLTRSASALSAINATDDIDQVTSSQSQSQPQPQSNGCGRGKRKRALSKAHSETGGQKKRKNPSDYFDSGTSQEQQEQHQQPAEVPDSQPDHVAQANPPLPCTPFAPQALTTAVITKNDEEVTIPSSLPEAGSEESSQVSSVGLGNGHGEEEDEHENDVDDGDVNMSEDDQDVQSQIALESQQSQSQRESVAEGEEEEVGHAPTLEVYVEEPLGTTPQPDKDIDMAAAEEGVKEEQDKAEAAPMVVGEAQDEQQKENDQDETEQEEAEQTEQAEEQALEAVQKLVSVLRGGLDILRSTKLSRQEVYQIEDLFMDMKKELYEAESRGRRSVGRD